MSEIEKILKDIVYGSVGAVASMLETGSGIARSFVDKGQKIVEAAKPAAEDWARKVQETCDEAKKTTGVDISQLTREQREQLTVVMAKLNKVEDAAAKALRGFVSGMEQAVDHFAEDIDAVDEADDEACGACEADEADKADEPDIVVEDPDDEANG